jgi:hypothetical protein
MSGESAVRKAEDIGGQEPVTLRNRRRAAEEPGTEVEAAEVIAAGQRNGRA